MRRILVAAGAACVLIGVAVIDVRAWGPQGHRLVGLIAAARLSPMAQVNVAWLLDKRSLADVSSWADQNIDGNAQTALWHYLNIPPDATAYDRDRDCPLQPGVAAGSRNDRWRDCVVDRILYSQDRLGNTALDRADRAVALKYLVHFVGDLHQPFHALGVERGGNGILVNVFGSPTCGTGPTPAPCNMHGVWDSALIARRQLDDAQYVAALEQLITAKGLNQQPIGTPAEWAMQSKDLARAALVPQQGQIDDAYMKAQMPVIDERLALGGIRLASFINAVMTSPPPELAAMIAAQDAQRPSGGSRTLPNSIASPTVVASAFSTDCTSIYSFSGVALRAGSAEVTVREVRPRVPRS
jgi:hypothetical protein